MQLSNLFDLIPTSEHAYLGRLVEMTVITLAHMPEEQRMREYAKAEVLYTHYMQRKATQEMAEEQEASRLATACAE